jgi:hypothetical protein
MRIDRYKLSENSTIDMDDAGDWVPYIQVSRLLGTFTTRDRFAASVAGGIFTQIYSDPASRDEPAHELHSLIAEAAYKIADAMMEARRK